MQKDWSHSIRIEHIYIYEQEIKIILKQDSVGLISNLPTSVYLSISKNLFKNNNHT